MAILSKVSGVWKEATGVFNNLSSVHTATDSVYVRVAGIWEKVWPVILEWTQQQMIKSTTMTAGNNFGSRVAMSGDTLVISEHDRQGGFVHVYTTSDNGTTWDFQQTFQGTDTDTSSDFFSYAIAIDGDILVVGAYGDDDGGSLSGGAYVFTRSGTVWTQQQKILPTDGTLSSSDYYGITVSISGNTAVVGGYADDTEGSNAGSIYVFVTADNGATWTQQQRLTTSDAAASDYLGMSLSIDGDVIATGTSYDDNAGGSNAGCAYIFTRSGSVWTENQKILSTVPIANSGFGISIVIQDDTLVIGAIYESPTLSKQGTAHVYKFITGSWVFQQVLVASDPAVDAAFGHHVDIDGDNIVVGANLISSDSGAAYVFNTIDNGVTWSEVVKLVADNPSTGDTFGNNVAILGNLIAIGSPNEDTTASDTGAVYTFKI